MSENQVIQCCIDKSKDCLEIVNELLELKGEEAVDPFYLDDDGLSGLDYLLMPDREGHSSGYFLVDRLYTILLVKYIELYYKNNPDDPVLHRNLQKICIDQKLFNALEQPLRKGIGLLLHTYCKPITPAGGVEVMKGTYAEAELSGSLPLAEEMEHGISIPVPPDRNFVTEEEEEQYVTQQMPEDLRAYREAEKRRGGLRKKRNNKRTKKASKKGKSKRTKRKSRKYRKSRN